MDITSLSVATARSLMPGEQGALLARRVQEIAGRSKGSAELSAEWLLLASTIVHVCSIVFETAKSVMSFNELSRARRLEEVLLALAKKSGDPTVSENPEVIKVAQEAIRLVEDDSQKEGDDSGQTPPSSP
jgi:hypothetical protein